MEADDLVENKLNEGLTSFNSGTYEIMSSQLVGPTIADDIKKSDKIQPIKKDSKPSEGNNSLQEAIKKD